MSGSMSTVATISARRRDTGTRLRMSTRRRRLDSNGSSPAMVRRVERGDLGLDADDARDIGKDLLAGDRAVEVEEEAVDGARRRERARTGGERLELDRRAEGGGVQGSRSTMRGPAM